MWCSTCQQDVPGVASAQDAVVRCARCHQAMSTVAVDHADVPTKTVGLNDWDDWDLENDLRSVDRVVRSLGISRHDAAHKSPAARLAASASTAETPENRPPVARPETPASASAFLSWTMLALGLMTFVFGAVLLGWSFWTERPELWRLGMPFTLGGQAGLVLGLIFQLDSLWRSNRQATEALGELDAQLHELRHATTLLGSSHSQHAKSFYLHMAEGAGPELLMADLKGQLDMLAHRLADQRR